MRDPCCRIADAKAKALEKMLAKLTDEDTPPESPGHNGAKMEACSQKMPPLQTAEMTALIVSRNLGLIDLATALPTAGTILTKTEPAATDPNRSGRFAS